MGYGLFRRPQISFFFAVVFVCLGFCGCGIMSLCGCEFVSLWVHGLVFCVFVCVCRFVCVCVNDCVRVFVCVPCGFV